MKTACAFCALLFGSHPVPNLVAQDTAGVGSISGTVRDSDDHPVSGVRTCILTTSRCAVSDDRGAFRLSEVRPGNYRMEITIPGQSATLSADVEARAGLDASLDISLPKLGGSQQSVTVSGSVFVAPEEVKNSGFLIQPAEIFQSAAALQDVSRYVQTLPGVAIGSDDFRNDIIVRGGSPLENLFIVDNIEIPNINSFATFASAGGTVGILDAALIQDVTFLTGGYPAPFGNRTSSVLQVFQREGSRERFTGRVTLGFAGAGTILEGPIKKDKGSWVVSARRSFLDVFTKDLGFGGVPVSYTFSGKALYDLTPRDRVWVVSLAGVDSIRLGATQGGKNQDEVDNFDIRYSGWRNASGFNWQHLLGERGVGLLGVSHSEARVGTGIKDLLKNGLPPSNVPVDQIIVSSPVVFREDSREGESSVKYDLTAYMPMLHKIQAGGSLRVFQNSYDTASPFGNDSPYSPRPGLNPFTLRLGFLASESGAYFQATQNLTSRLNLTWGGRFDNYQYIGKSRFSPRAGLSFRITERLSWRASYGAYYQQPFYLFLAAFPENRSLTPFRADHYVTGLSYVASSSLRFTIEAYRKNYKDYPSALQFPSVSLANLGDTFNIRDILFPLTSAGRGRAQGIELFVEKKFTGKLYGQANVSRSTSRQAGLDGVQRAASFDYPWIVNFTGGYRLSPKWEFASRFSYLAGRPYTPFDETVSRQQERGVFDLSQVNTVRFPSYVRLDIRADRTFTVRGKPLLLFAGAQNIINRKNIAGYVWNRKTNQAQVNTQLGLFPTVGLDWRF